MARGRTIGARRLRRVPPAACALVFGLLVAFLAPRRASAWSSEDTAYGNYLIRELRYTDTARRWLDSLASQRRLGTEDRAEIAAFAIDILLAEGKQREAEAALAKFKKDFPDHRRSSVGSLDVVGRSMAKVVALFDRAGIQPDPKRAAADRDEAKRIFVEEVEKPMDELVRDLNAKVDELKTKRRPDPKAAGPVPRSEELDAVVQARDQAELSRIKGYLVYARKLPDGSAERKATLEKGAGLAERFVRERYDYPVMQYEGQLQRGIIAFELGSLDEAQDLLSILYDIVPPWPGPYSDVVVSAFQNLRLQAVLFGARALVAAGATGQAVATIRKHFPGPQKDPFNLSKAEESPALRQFAVLVQLEYGVALACGGNAVEGLERIQGVIARHSGAAGESSALATEARRALGRVAGCAGVRLRGQDHYEAGEGLKSELRWEEAISSFRKALMQLDPAKPDDREAIARCLNQIGEINFILKRYVESALAYQEFYLYHRGADDALTSKVAQNFLAAATQSVESRRAEGGSSALDAILDEATKFNELSGSLLAQEELKMKQAQDLEADGRYVEARERFLQIRKESDGTAVPFYWRAQALARVCTYRLWDKADEEGKGALEADLEEALRDLGEIVPNAVADDDRSGAAVASLGLAEASFALDRYADAEAALEIFNGDLSEDVTYRCGGLSYLVIAKARQGKCDGGKKDFTTLYKLSSPGSACREEPLAGFAMQALSDCYAVAGEAKDAALFIDFWSRHPTAEEDVTKPEVLYQVIKRLYDGGRTARGDELLGDLEPRAAQDPELKRQVLVLKGTRFQQERQWEKLIETYEGYIAEYTAQGDHYDDPYVWQALGEAYIFRNPKPTFQDYASATRAYSAALAILNQRLAKEPSLDCTFWRWALRFCQLKIRIGEAGQPSSFGDVILLVDQHKHKEMCGLRDQFLKLADEARRRQSVSRPRK